MDNGSNGLMVNGRTDRPQARQIAPVVSNVLNSSSGLRGIRYHQPQPDKIAPVSSEAPATIALPPPLDSNIQGSGPQQEHRVTADPVEVPVAAVAEAGPEVVAGGVVNPPTRL